MLLSHVYIFFILLQLLQPKIEEIKLKDTNKFSLRDDLVFQENTNGIWLE